MLLRVARRNLLHVQIETPRWVVSVTRQAQSAAQILRQALKMGAAPADEHTGDVAAAAAEVIDRAPHLGGELIQDGRKRAVEAGTIRIVVRYRRRRGRG